MQRLFFYGLLIVVVVLLLALLDVVLYSCFRLICPRPVAAVVNRCMVIAALVALTLTCWYGHSHTRRQLVAHHVEIPSAKLPASLQGYCLAQISDLHLNSFSLDEGEHLLATLVDTLRRAQPDVIVFTGDLVTIRAAEAYPFRQALTALSQIPTRDGTGMIPVYSILGNHDYADYMRSFSPARRAQDVDSLCQFQRSLGWHMLNNEAVTLAAGQLCLVGVENIGEPPFSVYGDLEKALRSVATDSLAPAYTVLLSHNPTHWRSEVLRHPSIDLTLSGHTHAMQIKIGHWSPAKWKYPEWMGLYQKGHQYLYVNTGMGCVGPSVRIGVPPEVSFLHLMQE